jgi:hypothetical protein
LQCGGVVTKQLFHLAPTILQVFRHQPA